MKKCQKKIIRDSDKWTSDHVSAMSHSKRVSLVKSCFATQLLCRTYMLGWMLMWTSKRWDRTTCDKLCDLLPFAQFKKCEKHPWRSVTFSKVAG